MMPVKNLYSFLTAAALALGISLSASAQMPPPQEQPDEVDQLSQIVGLSPEQETEIRDLIDEIGPQIEELQAEVRTVQEELHALSGADFDEEQLRAGATRFGELTGEITALSLILQSRVDGVFTEEQRQTLDDLERQQQEMQQQQMQQQLQQQMQQQMQQQQPVQEPTQP